MPTAEGLLAKTRAQHFFALRTAAHKDAPAVRVLLAIGSQRGSWLEETQRRMLALEVSGRTQPQRAVMGKPPNHVFTREEVPVAAAIVDTETARLAQEHYSAAAKLQQWRMMVSTPWFSGSTPSQNMADVRLLGIRQGRGGGAH